MADLTLTPERPGDVPAIRALTEAAFLGKSFSDGTEGAAIDGMRLAGDLALSLVAWEGDSMLGHVALSLARISGAHAEWFGLGPISVRPDRQGEGIGAALIHAALDWMRRQAAEGCVLTGDPRYYGRFGFFSDGKLDDGKTPVEYILRKVLNGPDRTGEVRFAPALHDC